jgi:hypothetical protein
VLIGTCDQLALQLCVGLFDALRVGAHAATVAINSDTVDEEGFANGAVPRLERRR